MPFDPIAASEYASGQPVIGPTGFGQKTKENFDFLNGQIGSLEAQSILNGSFEVEDDAVSGVPANWDRTLFAGGAGAFETTVPMHGAQGYKFTHPGGGGNGGGSLQSDYFAIGQIRNLMLEWLHYVSAAGMHETVEVQYFTGAKVSVSTQTIYDSTSNPTSATIYQESLVIPATARFLKVKVIGGDDDVDVTGISYWDGIRIHFPGFKYVAGNYVIGDSGASKTANDLSFTKAYEMKIGGDGTLRTFFQLRNTGTPGHVMHGRIYRNGVAVGTDQTSTTGATDSFSEDIAGWVAGDTCELWAYTQNGASSYQVLNFSIRVDSPIVAGRNGTLQIPA